MNTQMNTNHADMKKTACVVLGVTGSIAAYKAADLVSTLIKRGIDVRTILTASGAQFITPLTLKTLSRAPVALEQFAHSSSTDVEHIELAKQADVLLIAPATANFIGKAANGIADDLLLSTFLAVTSPILIAPAMNSKMLANPVVQRNISVLRGRGCEFIEPEEGLLACGDIGRGRLAPIEMIVRSVMNVLSLKQDLLGKRILVTAGPTREAIDPVRFISNRSSGKMGFAIAKAAAKRGARVTLIAGPVHLETPTGVERINIVSCEEMRNAVEAEFNNCDALIMAAAPADYKVEAVSNQKLKKQNSSFSMTMLPTTDILKSLACCKKHQVIMGFAAETEFLEQNAKAKLVNKNLDFIAANDVSAKNTGFEVDTNQVTLFDKAGNATKSGLMNKKELANWLLNFLLDELNK